MTEDAFGAALLDHIPMLRRFAGKLTRNDADADDLLHTTLERALRKRALYKPVGPLGGWLVIIMRHCLLDEVRRRRGMNAVPFEEEILPERAQPAHQDQRLWLREVARAYEALSPEHRQILRRVAVDGASYEEVAQEAGIPVGTVRSRLHRARTRLGAGIGGASGEGTATPTPDPVVADDGRGDRRGGTASRRAAVG